MERFEIQQERDDEPVFICDSAANPDHDDCEIVTISPCYGTPAARAMLARRIKTILSEMAASGDELKPPPP